MESQLGRVYVNAYRGPVTERGALQYAREWTDIGLGSVDDLLTEQLNLSREQGRQKVTVLDLGSTRQATFLTDLLRNPHTNLGTRRFLEQNPAFSLELVGLTDAFTRQELDTVVNQTDVDTPQMRGSMRVVAYSLTARQTLERFLESQQIDSPNLVFAVWSLAYLSPNTFREVLTSSTSSLAQAGRFIGSGYSDSVSGFGFGMNYSQYPNLIYFDVQDPDVPQEVWPYLIGGPNYSDRPVLTTPQLRKVKQTMTKFLKPLVEQELLTEGQKDYLLSETRRARSIKRLSSAGATLQEPITNFWNYKFQNVLKPKKDAFIQELMVKTDYTIESDFVKNISILRG